ncbi:SurA N-terminal domain-containing protein [Bacillus sp. NTK071]|uniref:SurA N-terminal domain-containing protein n=1 Tax=Bacillus sp. NTK071 TaxID=2802175 RepID=UPI001A90C71A|nr:SurA N-terminal domain-containing protein [Bacillus sp. NTK071]MBN8207143.1 SurA N-terminal domain-containing protein [Bacillus sp. NTK071]
MKKQFSLLMLVVILLLAACSNTSDEKDTETTTSEDSASMDQTKKELEAMKVDEDKVVATVDGTEIKGKDYNSMLVQTQLRYTMSGKDPSNDKVAKSIEEEVMDNLIGQELLLQKAKDEGFSASEKEVQTELEQIKAQFSTKKELNEALKAQGMTLEKLESQYADIVVVDKFVNEKIAKPEVTEEEMKSFYDEQFTKDAENPPSFDEMKDRIKDYLIETKTQEKVQKMKDELKQKAEIEKML